MYTIRIVFPWGCEIVKQVKSIMLRPPHESPSGHECVTYFEEGESPKAVDILEGDIYLMNENGRTVADYHLHEPLPAELVKSEQVFHGSI